mmetsp:Transcript_2026/g.5337  ORF Transcript_2026/g.5337 Transcript_2026/m.5337 type:complete len:756 (-) Transcript_2026:258-2525(-)
MMLRSVLPLAALIASTAVAQPTGSCDVVYPGGTVACIDYTGSGWDSTSAEADCQAITFPSTWKAGAQCAAEDVVGTCKVVDEGVAFQYVILFYNGDATQLEGTCIGLFGGTWSVLLAVGRCDYTSLFLSAPVCRSYTGEEWTVGSAQGDCAGLSSSPSFVPDVSCNTGLVGTCAIFEGQGLEHLEEYSQGEATVLESGCVNFASGVWTAAPDVNDTVTQEAVDALQSDESVTVTPSGCDRTCAEDLQDAGGAIEFEPAGGEEVLGGVVFYPGMFVDPRAYAVWARRVAEAGYFVSVQAFMGGVAYSDVIRASSVIASRLDISRWAIAGHSQGGSAAAAYADAARDSFDSVEAVALFGAYPDVSNDLTGSGAPRVYMLIGDLDRIVDRAKFYESIARTPQNTAMFELRGGNHAQFGYYGEQDGDLEAEMPHERQTDLMVGATLHMLAHLGLDPLADFLDPIYAPNQSGSRSPKTSKNSKKSHFLDPLSAPDQSGRVSGKKSKTNKKSNFLDPISAPHQSSKGRGEKSKTNKKRRSGGLQYDASLLCPKMQAHIAGFSEQDLDPDTDIESVSASTLSQIVSARPTLDAAPFEVRVIGVQNQVSNPTDITAPAIFDGETWCKMKSQESFVQQYGFTPESQEGSCAEVNAMIFQEALAVVDVDSSSDEEGIDIAFIADLELGTGSQWVSQDVELSNVADGKYTLAASKLFTPVFIPNVPAEFLGTYYCKVWTVEKAVQFIKSVVPESSGRSKSKRGGKA